MPMPVESNYGLYQFTRVHEYLKSCEAAIEKSLNIDEDINVFEERDLDALINIHDDIKHIAEDVAEAIDDRVRSDLCENTSGVFKKIP